MQHWTKALLKAHIPLKNRTQRKQNRHEKNEIYMANTIILCWGPNATYIPPVCFGDWRWG